MTDVLSPSAVRPPKQTASPFSTLEFLDAVLPTAGRRCAGQLQNKVFTNYFEATNGDLADAVRRIDAKQTDAYFALGGFGADDSRKQDNVVALRSLWLDIDTQEGKSSAHYESRQEAMRALEGYRMSVRLPRPWVVSSGYGIHVYWPMDADIQPDIWLDTAKLLKASAGLAGLDIDNSRTTDITSVLRPPGTHNRKHDPAKLVEVVEVGETSTHGALHNRLEQHAPAQTLLGSAPRSRRTGHELNADLMLPPPDFPPSYLSQIAEQCAVMRHVRDTRGNVDQPTWYHALQLIGSTVEAETAIHDYSDGYAGYSAKETETVYTRASQYGPTTCAKFKGIARKFCGDCRYDGKITSPISLGNEIGVRAADCIPQYTATASTPQPVSVSSVRDLRPIHLTSLPAVLEGDDPSTILTANRLFIMLTRMDGHVFGLGLIGPNGTIEKLDPATARTLTANVRVRIAANGAFKTVPLFDYWLHHRDRLAFDDALFCPPHSGVVITAGTINTYRGLGVVGAPGQCLRILRHIYRVIADGDRDIFKYIVKYLAHLVVKPGERPGVAVILQGDLEGGGKSVFLNLIVRMVGDHSLSVPTTDRLSSRFNAQVENKIVVACHEGLLGVGHGQSNRLKSEITDPSIEIEGKGKDVRIVANYARYFLATNEVFPVRSGRGARRFLVCKTSNRYVGNRTYFDALYHEIDNGGVEAFLHFLQNHVALNGFNPSADMPRTSALAVQQEFSAPPHVKWALDVIDGVDGNGTYSLVGTAYNQAPDITFGQPASYKDLHANFRQWCAIAGERSTMSPRELGKWLREDLGLPVRQIGSNRLKGCTLPATASDFECRVRAAERMGS